MSDRKLLPCLRGVIGDWVTYTCLVRLKDIVELVGFAKALHNNKNLSDMIQRKLKETRTKQIGEYLLNEKEAFFNTLVVAIYKGEPKWHQFDTILPNTEEVASFKAPAYAQDSFGYLSLTGEEEIFALDGQHRLSGIQYALERNEELGFQQIPLTFLGHSNDKTGLIRTRRLFTTLNKQAKPVDKGTIISLDEDDIAACATRYLVEKTTIFNGAKLKFQATNNISYSDDKEITTIGNLYDLCMVILTKGLGMTGTNVKNYNGNDEHKDKCFKALRAIFKKLFDQFDCLKEFKNSKTRSNAVKKYRNKDTGGHFLYRPLGLVIYMLSMCNAVGRNKNHDEFVAKAEKFIERTKDMDMNLEGAHFADLIWDTDKKIIMKVKADERDEMIDAIVNYYIESP